MKNIKKILLLVICCFVNINFCYAAAKMSTGFNDPSDEGSGSGGTSVDTDNDGMINGEKDLGGDYTCYYDYKVTYGGDITIYGYDQNNEEIINDRVIPNKSIKAGTSIGISIIETKSSSWSYDFSVTKKYEDCDFEPKYNYRCTVYFDYYPYSKSDDKVMAASDAGSGCVKLSDEIKGYKETNCSSKEKEITSESNGNDKTEYLECENYVKGISLNAANSYVNSQSYKDIKLLNPNNATANDSVTISTNKKCDDCDDGSCSCTHMYTPKSVCMNKITSEVIYHDKNGSEICDGEEFKIENDVVKNVKGDEIEHFHYFVPLNVTSGSFSLILSESGDRQEKDWCEKAIKANQDNFYDFLVGVRVNGETFPLSDNVSTAISSIDYGCYVRTEIRIPVSEGLYNIDDNQKIKGYNLYVNNVNEYNPFPNPVTNTDSLWFEWYQNNYSSDRKYNGTGSPNFKDSFDEENVSYLLKNVKASDIRNLKSTLGNYLNNNLLPSGKSEFINGKINFDKFDSSYYQIGCGPINASKLPDGTVNPLHQVGCE